MYFINENIKNTCDRKYVAHACPSMPSNSIQDLSMFLADLRFGINYLLLHCVLQLVHIVVSEHNDDLNSSITCLKSYNFNCNITTTDIDMRHQFIHQLFHFNSLDKTTIINHCYNNQYYNMHY